MSDDKLMNLLCLGNIPIYKVVYPKIKQLPGRAKRSEDKDSHDEFLIEGLPFHDMKVKLKRNTKLHSAR